MTAAPMVLVAPLERVAGLVARLDAGAELLTFADSDALDALATITERHPSVIVIERFFAATPRGAALINRIKNDATLSGVEIRVLSHDNDHARTIATPPLARAQTAGRCRAPRRWTTTGRAGPRDSRSALALASRSTVTPRP